ncbi:MAG: hypothetical protein OSA84_07195 [Akkermansiaceae bacterium]|nr:hypothetical protein [Akkermansiaceae bacterium]
MKTILLVIASALFISSQSTAERSEHVGCYAEWGDAELTVENALVERKWTIQKGRRSFVEYTVWIRIRDRD